jgi:IS4 transposase
MHTLLDLRGNIPSLIWITDGKFPDVKILDELIPEPGAFYIMDRAYIDFLRLYILHFYSAFFVTRAKKNLQYQRIYSHPVDKSTGLRCDQTIRLTGPKSSQYYPEKLRRISYFDEVTSKRYTFLSNNFSLPALIIANLYKYRWQIELFFKWIKQHLRIKKFYGTSLNAVKTQIWIAISVYVLVAILKKQLKLDLSLYTILQILSVTIFEIDPLQQVLTDSSQRVDMSEIGNQLLLFDL